MEVYTLEKNSPGCTGMFWRPDPRPGKSSRSGGGTDWPRDGASLKGLVHEVNNEKWLECKEIKQVYSSDWEKCTEGCWMPFKYSQYYLAPAK